MKVAIIGGKGKLGQMIEQRMNELPKFFEAPVIIYRDDPIENIAGCDAIIDVTNKAAFEKYIEEYSLYKIPLIVATTGLSEDTVKKLKEMSKTFPIIMSGNFSITMYKFIESCKNVAASMPKDTNVTIIEEHHKFKLDCPSSTAKMIKEAILKVNPSINEGKDIEILSLRGGSIHGTHQVVFSNLDDEVITLEHNASSRKPFVTGIIKAVFWVTNFDSGFYTMDDFMMALNRT